MVQAIIATILQVIAMMFILATGMWLEEHTAKKELRRDSSNPPTDFKIMAGLITGIVLAACALGVAAR